MHDIRFPFSRIGRSPTVEAFLLGQIDFARCLELQRRLVSASHSRADGQISLIVCEHPAVITVGREGTRGDVRLRNVLLAGRQIDMYRVERSGGTMLHLPGQLAVYPIVPLDWYGWTPGEFLERFHVGLLSALGQLKVAAHTKSGRSGIWGGTGQLVHVGVELCESISYHGAQIHVVPPVHLFQFVQTDSATQTPIGSLYAECGRAVPMSAIRSRVVRAVAEAFGCSSYHCYTDHPLLRERSLYPMPRAS